MGKKISIVVPVYNGEAFFEKSLQSLLAQTLEDLEIIIINDGSTDGTQKIIDTYQERYPDRIKSRLVENGGAGKARNYALDLAEGEYIGFFDSDDFIAKDMYEKLYDKAVREDADIVVCGYYVATNTSLRSYQKGSMEYYGQSIYDQPDMFVYGVPYLWNKIFRRAMIEKNSIRFHDFRIFEDLEFTYRLFFLANRIVKVDEPLYYYMKLNADSLTARFTDRFFDIVPAMKSLVQFARDLGVYDQFKDYLLFIYMNHMYIRMNANVSFSDMKLKYQYIDACFDYMEEEFPDWRSHDYYFENKNRNKKRYISRGYWKRMSLVMKVSKRFRRLRRRAKKMMKMIVKRKPGAKYLHYVETCPVQKNQILLDSQHGEDLNGNMFYLLKELQKTQYDDYEIYVTVSKKRLEEFNKKLKFYEMAHVKLLIKESNQYLRVLATAGYLFNDTSFPTFFMKRREQVYFNTWHGTPLKTLGKKTREDFYNIGNLQKNFNAADYLLYPSEYMMQHMVEDYMLANISHNQVALIGYPRNAVFFDEERRQQIRRQQGLEGKEIISYMPTWRGTLNNQDNDDYVEDLQQKLTEISGKLKDDQVLYLNVHPYLKDYIQIGGFDNVFMFPKEYETYDFLNISDILITDYSSVFFDFACTGRRILLFAYDKEEYMRERGLYIDFDQLPFPMVETVDALIDAINDQTPSTYDEFIDTYARYDSADVNEKICEQIILGKEKGIRLLDVPDNQRPNVLCVANDLSSYFLNEEFFRLADNSDTARYNYYLTFINANLYKHKRELLRLPQGFEYYGQLFKFVHASFMDRAVLWALPRFSSVCSRFAKRLTHLFEAERDRLFNEIDFSYTIVVGEKKNIRLLLFAQMKGKKILYVPYEREFNSNISPLIYRKYDQILIENPKLAEEAMKKYPDCAIRKIPRAASLDELIES